MPALLAVAFAEQLFADAGHSIYVPNKGRLHKIPDVWGFGGRLGRSALHAEQIRMGAGAVEVKGISFYAISQQPIRQDMAFTKAIVFPV